MSTSPETAWYFLGRGRNVEWAEHRTPKGVPILPRLVGYKHRTHNGVPILPRLVGYKHRTHN
jgi:hypothetical protein